MLAMPILLADLKEIMTAIVPLIMLIFWIISQVFGEKGAQPKQAKPAGNPRPKPDEGGLKEEIERFLQEAKQQQQQKKPERSLRQDEEPEAEEIRRREREQREREERMRRKQENKRQEQQRKLEAARRREKELSERGSHRHEEIVEDVQVVGAYPEAPQERSPYQQSEKFVAKAAHLGEDIDQTDERLQKHLKEVFDHQLGNFADSPDAPLNRERDLVTINEITSMLRNPSNFRQAIIMKEILERPKSHW